MNCPVCNVPLTMTERQNIEIDYCPQCRGVWLDRGELDKIIERSHLDVPSRQREEPRYRREEKDRRPYPEQGYRKDQYHGKKRKSFLGEIFDFD